MFTTKLICTVVFLVNFFFTLLFYLQNGFTFKVKLHYPNGLIKETEEMYPFWILSSLVFIFDALLAFFVIYR